MSKYRLMGAVRDIAKYFKGINRLIIFRLFFYLVKQLEMLVGFCMKLVLHVYPDRK